MLQEADRIQGVSSHVQKIYTIIHCSMCKHLLLFHLNQTHLLIILFPSCYLNQATPKGNLTHNGVTTFFNELITYIPRCF